eukprot:scaffold166094_cov46-Attheya_sp.AAC.3
MLHRIARHVAAPVAASTTASFLLLSAGEKGTTSIHSRCASMALSPNYNIVRNGVRRAFSSNNNTTVPPTATTAAPATAAATMTESAVTKKSSGGLLAWYEGHLQANPVPTKMVSGAILWGLGDAVAQGVPALMTPASSTDEKEPEPFQYDMMRTGRAVFFGFVLHAPLSHVHFNFLESLTVRANVTGLGIPLFKTVMEQFVYWSWFSNSLYHGAMGAMQGQSVDQVYHRISDVLWETQKAQWVFWIPVQLLNFRFVPIRHQLNVVLVTSVVWTALLSAWYPPVVQDEESKSSEESTTTAAAVV